MSEDADSLGRLRRSSDKGPVLLAVRYFETELKRAPVSKHDDHDQGKRDE